METKSQLAALAFERTSFGEDVEEIRRVATRRYHRTGAKFGDVLRSTRYVAFSVEWKKQDGVQYQFESRTVSPGVVAIYARGMKKAAHEPHIMFA